MQHHYGLPVLELKATILKYIKAHKLDPVSYTHLRAHETVLDLVCRLLLEKNKQRKKKKKIYKKKKKQK